MQNLPYKFKKSYGDFQNRNIKKSHIELLVQMVVGYSGTKNRLYTHIIVYSHLHKNPFQIFLKITSLMGASIVSDKKLNSEI